MPYPQPDPFDAGFDQGFDRGYTSGYAKGYEAGVLDLGADHPHQAHSLSDYDAGFDAGFTKGYAQGHGDQGADHAEQLVQTLLPDGCILPQYTASELVRLGLAQVERACTPLLSAEAVAARLEAALSNKEPLSLVRLGDGEALTLAQECVLAAEEIKLRAPWLARAGVRTPDLAARDALRAAVLAADIVGVPTARHSHHQPLLFKAFAAHEINWHELTLTHADLNHRLLNEGFLREVAAGRRVLLVGNLADALAPILSQAGVDVAGTLGPVRGVPDIPRIFDDIRRCAFDLALIAAGVAAAILAPRVATETGKVAIDFGHAADALVYGQIAW